jgi:hypothetical protein
MYKSDPMTVYEYALPFHSCELSLLESTQVYKKMVWVEESNQNL